MVLLSQLKNLLVSLMLLGRQHDKTPTPSPPLHDDEFQQPHHRRALSVKSNADGCAYEPSHCLCLGMLEASEFNLVETSKFDKWFNDDSVFHLAEAGRYEGLENIREYVDFASSEIYKPKTWENRLEQVFIPESIMYNPATEQCTIAWITPSCHTFSPLTLGGSFDFNAGFKLKFKIVHIPSPQEPRAQILVETANFYLPKAYYERLDRVMRTNAVADKVCNIMEFDCPQTFQRNFPSPKYSNGTALGSSSNDCVDKMLGLQYNLTEVFDGNSFGCRVLHANLATKSPHHCPHISFIPEKDKYGYVKCQESSGTPHAMLFSEVELDLFENYESDRMMTFNGTSSRNQYFAASTCADRYANHEQQGFGAIGLVLITLGVFMSLSAINYVFFWYKGLSVEPTWDRKKSLEQNENYDVMGRTQRLVPAVTISGSSSSFDREEYSTDLSLSVPNKSHLASTPNTEQKGCIDLSLPVQSKHSAPQSSSDAESYELGIMVNKLVEKKIDARLYDKGTERNHRWTSVIIGISVAFITMVSFIVPLAILVVEPSINERSNINTVLLDAYKMKEESVLSFTDSHPISMMESNDFSLYLCLLVWVWVNAFGFGLEFFVTLIFLQDGWMSNHEYWWRLVQHIFPIGAVVCYQLAVTNNFIALVILFLTVWKCGFPETVATMYSALFDTALPKVKRVCYFFDAVGLVWHHTSIALGVTYFATGVAKPERSILEPFLLVTAQHGFSLLRYWYKSAYTIILLLLEIFFQWSVVSNIENYARNHWTVTVTSFGMIFAHWVWVCTASVMLVKDNFPGGNTEGMPHCPDQESAGNNKVQKEQSDKQDVSLADV